MSLPARRPNEDDTVPSEPAALVCPRCKKTWPEAEAPPACPVDKLKLVRPKDLVDPGNDPMVGRTLEGRYTILARLGAGSMGTVYRAKQHAMGREVAIKILRGDRAVDDSAKGRFMREARANSLLASPNTVTVFDFGQSESGEFYLAMELLEGESLGQRLNRLKRIPPAQAVDAVRQALRSLGEAHAKGIIHRDLKPDNLFYARVLTSGSNGSSGQPLQHDEIVKVLDFGIAKMTGADDGPMGVVETQAGTVFGTPRYMSPEQAQGKPLDARSDLYSLAVILYQMVTGRPPFQDTDAVVVMARHIKSIPKRPNEANPEAKVPRELEDVIMRTLAKEPHDRPATAEILAAQLLTAIEAQGSLTSGVRTTVTNAAGIPLPESMRPPALPGQALGSLGPLPAIPKRSLSIAWIVIPLVFLVPAIVVFWLLTRSHPTPSVVTGASTSSAAAPGASLTEALPQAAVPRDNAIPPPDEPPVITPDSLPQASQAQPAGAKPPHGHGNPAAPGQSRPAGKGHPAGATSGAPATAPSYGIFD